MPLGDDRARIADGSHDDGREHDGEHSAGENCRERIAGGLGEEEPVADVIGGLSEGGKDKWRGRVHGRSQDGNLLFAQHIAYYTIRKGAPQDADGTAQDGPKFAIISTYGNE